MANLFADLPVPAGVGVGASVDTTAFGRIRTITAQGTFVGTITIEISQDNTNFFPITSFTGSKKKTVEVAAAYMRVRRSGDISGTANVDVASDDAGGDYVQLVAPAGDGAGAAVDVSAFGTFNTIVVSGTFTGTVHIEISEDNVDWATLKSVSAPSMFSREFVAQYMRVRRAGTTLVPGPAGTPTIYVGAIQDSAGGGGGGGGAIPEKWYQTLIAASQTDVDLNALVSVSFDTIKAIRAGNIVGLSTRFTAAITDATAGSAVITVTVNGAAGTLSLSHSSGTNPSGGEATQASGIDTFVAGDLIGIQITTLGTFAPADELAVEAWIETQA